MGLVKKIWRYATGYFWVDLSVAGKDWREMGWRFAASGLRSRFGKGRLVPVPLKEGAVHVRAGDSDFETLRQVFRDHSYGALVPHVVAAMKQRYEDILARGKVPIIVDAGANIGAASLWFKNRFPKAAIVAVEPDSANAALARANLATLDDVQVIEAAIGSEPGHVAVMNEGSSYGVQTARSDSGCRIITMPECVAAVPNGELFIAKVDIEGFESDLFASNVAWVDEAFLIYIEPHEWMLPGKHSSRSFQRVLGGLDYALHLSGENLVYVKNEQAPA